MKKVLLLTIIFVLAATAVLVCGVKISDRSGEISVKPAVKNELKSEKASENVKEIKGDAEKSSENEKADTAPKGELDGRIIVVDAGHGKTDLSKQERIAPDSDELKAAFASGTSGAVLSEEELNLAVALKLEKALKNLGAEVKMTRTEHESDMTNIDRAEFANKANADLSVKIHADGNDNGTVHGVSVLVPGTAHVHDSSVIEKSRKAGGLILEEFVKSTGAFNRGVTVRDDLTGFNWSEVPIVLVEMGFMTNPTEDGLMSTEDYQNKMVSGMVNGICRYFER